MAQKLYAGAPYKWTELTANDEVLLSNAGTINHDIAVDLGIAQFLCGYTIEANGNQTGISLAKTDTLDVNNNSDPTGQKLTEANVWILVDAGKITTLENKEYQAFFLKNKKTGEYIEAFPQVTDGITLHTTPSLGNATSFVIQSVDTYEGVRTTILKRYEEDPDYGAVFSHYVVTKNDEGENVGTWYHLGHFWHYTYTYYGTATEMAGWNVMRVEFTQTWEDKLSILYTSFNGKEFNAGTDPGCYGEDEVIAFEDVLVYIEDSYCYYCEEWTEEDYKIAYEKLKKAYEELLASQVPLTDGLYYIIIDNIPFRGSGKNFSPPAYQARNDGLLWWASISEDKDEASFVWQITKTGEGTYSVKNLAHNMYLGCDDSEGHIPLEKTMTCEYAIKVDNRCCWNLIPCRSGGLTGGLWGDVVSIPFEEYGKGGYITRNDNLESGAVQLRVPSAEALELMGAKALKSDNAQGPVYSLDGRRVAPNGTRGLSKGIYIVGGKKVAVTK